MKLLIITFMATFCCVYGDITEGFENMSGTPSGTWGEISANCKGTSTATIDSSQAHSGKNSLKIVGNAGYCNHIYIGPTAGIASIGKTVYVRLWMKHTTALPADHVAFIAMKDASDGGKDLRIGGQNKALQWNREGDDATLPEQSPNGVALSAPLPTDKWVCLQFMVNGATGEASTWLDGKEIAGLHAGNKVKDIDSQWSSKTWRPSLQDFRVGWEAYGNGADTLWYDDIAIGSSKIAC